MRSTATIRRALGVAAALAASLTLIGSGVASADPETGSAGSTGSASTATAAPQSPFDFESWDTCPLNEILEVNDAGQATPKPGGCQTLIIKGGNLKLGSLDVALPARSVMVAGGQKFIFGPDGRQEDWFPKRGSIHSGPITVPGGALGTASSEFGPAGITAYLEEVSTPNFTGNTPDTMGFRMPVKIKLANPLLGNNCYIGSDSNPVILHSTVDTLTAPQAIPTGEPGQFYENITASDGSFAVPAATGCGLWGSLNWAVNARAGLPSAAGNNSLNITADLYTGVPYQIWLYRQSH